MKKPVVLLCLFLFTIYVSIGFLTFNSLKNQKATAQYNQLQQKVSDSEQLIELIDQQLEQVKTQLSALTTFLDTSTAENLSQLTDRTPIIESIFVIQNRSLVYPQFSSNQPMTEKEQQLSQLLTSFANTPSILLQHAESTKDKRHQFGWFNHLSEGQPRLIYWQEEAEQIIGYLLSYSTLRAHLIASADKLRLVGQYQLFDNGQLLLSNKTQTTPTFDSQEQLKVIRAIDYPLQHWSVDYILPPAEYNWAPAILLGLTLASLITWIAMMAYRQTQRQIHLASRQVQFVGQVSHELKTPLTNIRLYAELLEESELTNPQSTHYLQVISDESHRLTRLIQNVLNFTKSPAAHLTSVKIDEVINKLAQTFTPTFEKKNLQIRLINHCPTNTYCYSDADMMMQILSNFMSNAEKYAANGQYVDILATLSGTDCTIAIRDYGKGVSNSELKQLTKPFYRVHNHLTEGVAGTGIGLTIAKQLADTLSATLKITRQEKGMLFSLTLPLNPQRAED